MEKMEKDIRVLIADENGEVRRRCREIFTEHGCTAEEASNGEEAFRMMNRQSCDLVIADLWLSGMDGTALMKKAAELHPSP